MANVCPSESLTCTISKDPGCLSLWVTVPTRPKLRPPVIIHKFPAINPCFTWGLNVPISPFWASIWEWCQFQDIIEANGLNISDGLIIGTAICIADATVLLSLNVNLR